MGTDVVYQAEHDVRRTRGPYAEPQETLRLIRTPRKIEIIILIASGHSCRQFALQLSLFIHTVERHVSNIYQQFGYRIEARPPPTYCAIG